MNFSIWRRLLWGLIQGSSWSPVRLANHYTKVSTLSERHRKAFSSLQSCLTDSSWINLIHLIQLIQYKVGNTRIRIVACTAVTWQDTYRAFVYAAITDRVSCLATNGHHSHQKTYKNPHPVLSSDIWRIKHGPNKSLLSLLLLLLWWSLI